MDVVDRVQRLLGRPGSDRALRSRVLAEIGTGVRFDAHVFAMTDPVTGVVSSPHATVPMVPAERLPEVIARRYATPALEEWSAWLAREHGIAGTLRVDLRDRWGDWGFLELWRTDSGFGAGDRAVLAALAPALTSGLRSTVAGCFEPGGGVAVEPGVILLDPTLQVRSQTDPAAAALLRLLPPDEDVPPVPAAAYNVGAALLAGREPWARMHVGAGRLMTARADRIADGIAVSISPCSRDLRVDLFGRAHALSPRETEVLGLVLRGQDSRAVAASLTIAPTTAEDHLRALLAKTGSRSRQHLIVRAVGG
jgi:DNA-binding CsgD family transcriptional regulator